MPIADTLKQLSNRRLRILWIVLGALLLVQFVVQAVLRLMPARVDRLYGL